MAEDGWLQAETDGSIMLRVRVIPRSRQAGFGPVRAGRLVARITRPPVDGKANQELLKTLASALGCKRAELSIVQGVTTRDKTVRVVTPPADLRMHWPVTWGCNLPVCPSQRGSLVTPLKRRGSRPDWNQLTKVMMLNIGRPSAWRRSAA